nr:hypothetical protein CFP56_69046 [Quercus suber]
MDRPHPGCNVSIPGPRARVPKPFVHSVGGLDLTVSDPYPDRHVYRSVAISWCRGAFHALDDPLGIARQERLGRCGEVSV